MRPTKEAFQKAVEQYGGNLTLVAKSFGISRTHIYTWINENPEFKEIVDDSRGSIFDECLSTARVMARGIPDIQDGKLVGYIREPDGAMCRYLMSTLGKKEGFGESIDVTTNGKDISTLNGVDLFRVLTKEEIENFKSHFDENF